MKPQDDLEAFTLTALDLLGGATEERTAGLYTVLWPVSGAGHLETRQVAFDPDLLDEHPEAELVTFGRRVDLIMAGRVTTPYLPQQDLRRPPPQLQDRAVRQPRGGDSAPWPP